MATRDLVLPRHTRSSIALPHRSSSLIDAVQALRAYSHATIGRLPVINLDLLLALIHGCSGRCHCLACMLTWLIDVRMYVRTSLAAVQLNFCSVLGVLSTCSNHPRARTSRLAHPMGLIRPSNWSSLRCGSYTLPTPPRVALRVLQVRCLWCFRRAGYLHHVGTLAGVSAVFRSLSSPLSTPQTLIAGFPSSTAISLSNVRNFHR